MDDRSFLDEDFTISGRQHAILQRSNDAISVAKTAARLPSFNAPSQPTAGLVCEIFKEKSIHRALEPNVQMIDLAFANSDDSDANECQTFEQPGRVLLISAESVQRLRKNDIELPSKRVSHQRLKPRSKQRGTGESMIGVLLDDRPSLALSE